MTTNEAPNYKAFLSDEFLVYTLKRAVPAFGISELRQVGPSGGLETEESFRFLCRLYEAVEPLLAKVLKQRILDRKFIDERTACFAKFNAEYKIDLHSDEYETVLGLEDASGRVVVGPLSKNYHGRAEKCEMISVPDYLQGPHVTLFGPPGEARLSINAMNAYHRKLKGEPEIVERLLKSQKSLPKWGADDEDSKTPLREDLIVAGENLTKCFEGSLSFTDPSTQKQYRIADDHQSVPIKRIPGLAIPCGFLFFRGRPIPLHLYDFALHLFRNWKNTKSLTFYVPKLENEEEASYLKTVIETAEKMIHEIHPEYSIGTVRVLIVLENPRAVFRVHEIMDALRPYFVGASLGWHDYLASTARLFKEDPQYRIPVKADPNIVIKYIKASHELLANTVGSRGGIKIGGMYGILPSDTDLQSDSFQITLRGYFKDVFTQLKRDLSGFWVAHPDFIRLGLAMVEAWGLYKKGDQAPLRELVEKLLRPEFQKEVWTIIEGQDVKGLDPESPLFQRSLLVADLKQSDTIANNDREEIRYNVFQSLQYLTDWLTGNGCVALPATIDGTAVRVMDDLATAERSRWEVWHELYHGRFSVEEFIKTAFEEMHFIRKDLSNTKKVVQVKFSPETAKWYPVAFKLMVQLMTSRTPVEFASELLLPFTDPEIRRAEDPWRAVLAVDPKKFKEDPYLQRLQYYFSICGSLPFAVEMAKGLTCDLKRAQSLIEKFDLSEIRAAAAFHGDIGQAPKGLDQMAANEQALVLAEKEALRNELLQLGQCYLERFGFKFLISAKGRAGGELLSALKSRMLNGYEEELQNAREALWEISLKRFLETPLNTLADSLQRLRLKQGVRAASFGFALGLNKIQEYTIGEATPKTLFEIASLSKTLASAFSIEYFRGRGINLDFCVNDLLKQAGSTFKIQSSDVNHPEWADQVKLSHLMSHSALNMHYVRGFPLSMKMPTSSELLQSAEANGYEKVCVTFEPGTQFKYSGAGFIVLEHLIEALEKKPIAHIIHPFLSKLGLQETTFESKPDSQRYNFALGYGPNGQIEGGRLMFPGFAAGALGTPGDVLRFLQHLSEAKASLDGSGPISHDTAVQMLFATDKGCFEFMGAKMGLGVFVAEAGPNLLAIHQGANDGFRAIYVYCVEGPDRGKGFSICCDGELNGVLFIAEAAQEIFKHLEMDGVDLSAFGRGFSSEKIKSEEVVNRGYKELIFSAFEPQLPDPIFDPGPVDPILSKSLCKNAKILKCTDQRFARAENLFSIHSPVFDPTLFCAQGKVMDSWESGRHSPRGEETLEFEVQDPIRVGAALFSTEYHLGNQVEYVALDGLRETDSNWFELVEKTKVDGHALKQVLTKNSTDRFKRFRVRTYPDGGLSRMALFEAPVLGGPFDRKCESAIPKTHKPLAPSFSPLRHPLDRVRNRLKNSTSQNVASSALGAVLVGATNEHYGPAAQVISPFCPIHMFDGLESARSRKAGHFEQVTIRLAEPRVLRRIELDFTYFVNNNPSRVQIEGQVDSVESSRWVTLVRKTDVKPYAGNKIRFELDGLDQTFGLRVTVFPDGGIHRISAF